MTDADRSPQGAAAPGPPSGLTPPQVTALQHLLPTLERFRPTDLYNLARWFRTREVAWDPDDPPTLVQLAEDFDDLADTLAGPWVATLAAALPAVAPTSPVAGAPEGGRTHEDKMRDVQHYVSAGGTWPPQGGLTPDVERVVRAARARLRYGHNDTCDRLLSPEAGYACTCGHDELYAALRVAPAASHSGAATAAHPVDETSTRQERKS